MPVQPRRRNWRVGGTAQSDDEARAHFQDRLAVFSKLLFWSFVALLVFLTAMYWVYPIAPANQPVIYGVAVIALAILAVMWRVVLVRGTWSMDVLQAIDVFMMIGSGVTFGSVAALAYDLQASSYTCLLYQSFVVFTRALVVPSSARRTAVTSSLAFVPIVAGAIVLVSIPSFVAGARQPEIPGPAFVIGDILYNAVAVALATTGSQIIYGLRKQVKEARQLGHYTLGDKIGAGGMGEVYHAKHLLLRRATAVKLLSPERLSVDALDRFEREVQAMSRLTHPNTVTVFDYGRGFDGGLYYAMEYLGGLDLGQLVRLDGPQRANRVVHILTQVCGALQEAHDAGLTHRDIKPGNIILCERGGLPDVAKVVDYGLVKDEQAEPGLSAQVIVGTPHYMAPEAAQGTVSPAIDLYALGAVGYYLLTGRHVFEGGTSVEILVKHVTAAPKRPSEVATIHVPRELEDIIMRCLAKAPADRYASARELGEALERVPRSRDWDRDEAARWWREFHVRAAVPPVTSDTETRTITVDLEGRA